MRKLEYLQDGERSLKDSLAAAQHFAERYQKELSGERQYRYLPFILEI